VRDGELDKKELFQQVLRVVYRIIFLLVAEERDALHAPTAPEAARNLYRAGYSLGRIRDLAVGGFRGTAHGDLWRATSLVFERLAEGGAPELGLNALGSFLFSPSSTPDLVGAGTFKDPASTARHGLAVHRTELRNRDFLLAMRALSVVVDPTTKKERAVDFRALGAEELGSVYEGLLELHLDSASWPGRFRLATSAGNERKTSGSYYTPDSLVQCLLDSALEPVVKDATKGKKGTEAAEAILRLKVCDPAVGSGHFLIAAAHRLAKHVARARAGDSEPTPDEHRTALREVIRRCMYGVDVNPMSAELCRVALWMESMEPGKPLSFLESHIVVGNSLIGATPRLLAEGITDGAFEVLEGDEKAAVSALKKRNKQERKDVKSGQGTFDFGAGGAAGVDFTSDFAQLATASDASAAEVASLAKRHAELQQSAKYSAERLKADAWCAAFFWKKDGSALGTQAITEATFRSIEKSPDKYPIGHPIRNEIERLRREHGFLHLHLAFPEVFRAPKTGTEPKNEHCGWDGGFDCILGNPPWDQILFREQEHFAESDDAIASAATSSARKEAIAARSAEDAEWAQALANARRRVESERSFFQSAGVYPLSGHGRVGTQSLFAELSAFVLCASSGRVGVVLPTGLLTDDSSRRLFVALLRTGRLLQAIDVENSARIFSDIDSRSRFLLFTVRGAGVDAPTGGKFAFGIRTLSALVDGPEFVVLTAADCAMINPNTGTAPAAADSTAVRLLLKMHARYAILLAENGGPSEWRVHTRPGLFNMSGASDRFMSAATLGASGARHVGHMLAVDGQVWLPLYEGKMVDRFDHRTASVVISKRAKLRQGQAQDISDAAKSEPTVFAVPRHWVARSDVAAALEREVPSSCLVGWKEVTSPTNERTLVPVIVPVAGVGHKIPLIFASDEQQSARLSLICLLSSFAVDWVVRQKLTSTSLTPFTVKQLPVPSPVELQADVQRLHQTVMFSVEARMLELSATADDMSPFSKDLWPEGDGVVFRYDPERRFEIRCELDAAFFHLYLGTADEWKRSASPELRKSLPTPRDAVAYIMDTFPIVRRKDEEAHGHFRTKDRILALYDELQRCLASGQPFKSTLNPPPGPPTNPDGTFAALPAWPKRAPKPANWPAHIHPPISQRRSNS
jgi:hypothetical protein